jgi:hypothetical protein
MGALVATAACGSLVGIDEFSFGSDVDGGGTVDASATSSSGNTVVDASRSGGPVDTGAPPPPQCACTTTPPNGWTSVAYASDRNTTCSGDLRTVDLVTDPAIDADAGPACSCGACNFTFPSCEVGTYTARSGHAGNCGEDGTTTHDAANACQPISGALPAALEIIPPAAQGTASCTAPGVGNANSVTTKAVRVCEARPSGKTCACEAPNAFTQCIQTAGDLPCPVGFATKHVTGSSASAKCDGCGCTTANLRCTGSVTYYSDPVCVIPIATINDQTCQPTSGATFESSKFTGKATATCTTTPPTTDATTTLADTTTICCP